MSSPPCPRSDARRSRSRTADATSSRVPEASAAATIRPASLAALSTVKLGVKSSSRIAFA
jgi:hypothetical protein